MRHVVLIILIVGHLNAVSQNQRLGYEKAFSELKGMLTDSIPLSFKRAVFVTEDAYAGNQLSYEAYDKTIGMLAKLSWNISRQNPIIYKEADATEVNKYAAVFKLLTDTVKFHLDSSNYFLSEPFGYDFDDFWGEKHWEKMFVTKLLGTHKGNCHSLPFLYKILCEELGAKAFLAMAPNHTYIKQWCKKTGWYNTELTSRYFPIDAWIMASGYVHLSAVQNRLYMDTLSQKMSVAVCVTDLAKGYERRFPEDFDFIEKCADLALKYYPRYTNALILKAEITKRKFEKLMADAGAKDPAQVLNRPDARLLFGSMETQYSEIHRLGYRMMPKEMYVKWLGELRRERDKYQNRAIISNFIQTTTK